MNKKTNILLITSDQQHWTTLGVLNPDIKTPNLDRLANEGVLFERAYCPNPTCTPTRASLITGKFPSQHGGWTLGTKLPESEPTVGDVFRDHGYRTLLVGKAHFQQLESTPEYPSLESYPIMQDLDFWRNFKDVFYGFDHVELARNHTDEAHVGQHYAIWMEEKGFMDWKDHFSKPTGTRSPQKHKWSIPEDYHYNTWIAERTNALLDGLQDNDEPFFLWSSFFDPHPSYLVPEPWDTMYDPAEMKVPQVTPGEHDNSPYPTQLTQMENPREQWAAFQEEGGHATHGCQSHLHDRDKLAKDMAVYYGMVSCMDKYIGKILDHLDELGLAENTLVVFTTDHGHFYGHHGLIAKGPFHYEDMIKVPMIVRQPGTVPAGVRSNAIQSLVDLPVTFLHACGITVPDDMTGLDQLGTWRGDAAARDHAIVEFHHQPTTIHMRTYVDERYKLTIYCNRPYGEIFDLQNDPGELDNLWDNPDHVGLKEQLLVRMLKAEVAKEEKLTDELLQLPQKSKDMYLKTFSDGHYLLNVHEDGTCHLEDLHSETDGEANLWDEPSLSAVRLELVQGLLYARLSKEPIWMPRVAGA